MKLQWTKNGVQNRKPVYFAEGTDSLSGEGGSYQIYNEGGVWRGGGDNVRRTGGFFAKSVSEAQKKCQAIEDAAVKAFSGGYNLSADLVETPSPKRSAPMLKKINEVAS